MKKRGRRWKRILIITGLLVILCLVGYHFLLGQYVPRLIKKQIIHLVVDGSDSLYKCSVGDVSVNLIKGRVVVRDLIIEVDSFHYRHGKSQHQLPNLTYKIGLERGSISGLKLYPLVFSNKLIARTIQAENVNIALCRQYEKTKSKVQPSEELMWKLIRSKIDGIYINRVLLDKIKFSYRNSEEEDDLAFSYEDCSANFENIRIDSLGAQNSSRILFTEDIVIHLKGVKYITPDSIYTFSIDSVSYSSFLKKLQLKKLRFQPNISIEERTIRRGMQVDLFETVLPEIMANNFRIEKLVNENTLSIDTLAVHKGLINIYRDRNAPSDTTVQLGRYPHEILASTSLGLRIPYLLINDAEVHYIERQALTKKKGDLFFTHINGSISNITNHPEDLEKNSHVKVSLDGYFLHTGKMKVRLDFDLASANGVYDAIVTLGYMEAEELNKVLVPFGNVRLNSLVIHEGYFALHGERRGTTGTVKLRYNDLNVQILKMNEGTENKPKPFATFVANLFAIRPDNPAGGKEFTAQDVYVERKRRQPFTNLVWETFFEGSKKVTLKIKAPHLKVKM